MNILLLVIFLFSLLAIISLLYFTYDFHKNKKFEGYLQFIGAFAIIFTVIAIIIQVSSSSEKITADSITFYSDLKKSFVEENFKLFMQYPRMNYYYRELMGIDYNIPNDRDKTLENQITMVIFDRLSTILYFIEENQKFEIVSKKSLVDLEKNMVRLVGLFFRSVIFRENWEFYKKSISGYNVKKFINKFFPNYY